MVPLRLPKQSEAGFIPLIDSEAMAFLNHLRSVAMSCRTKPRTALFEACAMLQTGSPTPLDAHADVLMRCLGEALGTPARLYTPGTEEMTFDERWLVQLGIAFGRADEGSCQFLLGSRVARENRRHVGYLASQIAARFSLN